jgi:hypothetical protein
VAPLQQAFERRPPASSQGGLCTANLDYVPAVAFVAAAGQWIVPVGRRDGCGHLSPQLHRAAEHVTWQEVAVHKIRQLVSPQARAAHCDQQYKNENAMYAELGSADPTVGGPVMTRRPSRVTVCIYRGGAAGANVGDFVRGEQLTGHRAGRLIDALTRPAPAGSCAAQNEFAVISSRYGNADVELGGCWRVRRDGCSPRGTGSADASAVRTVLGLGKGS